ncbi:MAG: AAA family ATPase [Acidimicrobiia bacterium]|nr:AAA family ATPase [Acidimicrobiia bacterium]
MNISPPLLNRDTAVLTPFVDAGILDASAVHVADAIARGVGGIDFESLLGAALAARAPALGHVCIVPATVADSIVIDDSRAPAPNDLPWPDPDLWVAGIAASPAVRVADDPPGPVVLPLVWDGTRLYLERYWRYEQHVADDLLRRAGTPGGVAGDYPDLDSLLDPLFGPGAGSGGNRQREAAERALTSRLVVVAGGPGTGKTYTIARLLTAALRVSLARGQTLDFALAAPTGKASARMTEAVRDEIATTDLDQRVSDALRDAEATTIHRLLGPTPGIRFRHDQTNPLPHDLVIVDETSMVSLPLMSRLLAAVRPDATVVLVGDPYQLASVEAGAVLGEIVGTSTPTRPEGPLAHDVVLLERVHRFGADSPIAALADAVRVGDADLAVDLLRTDRSGELTWVDGDDAAGISVLQQEAAAGAVEAIRAAHAGDASAGIRHASDLKVLCATRLGRLGVAAWSDRIEALAGACCRTPASDGAGTWAGRSSSCATTT